MATPGKIAELDDRAQRRIAAALDNLTDTLGIETPPDPFPARQPELAAAYERERFAEILERVVARLQAGAGKPPVESPTGETAGESTATADAAKSGPETNDSANDGGSPAKPAERPAEPPKTPHKGTGAAKPKAGKR